MRLTRSAVVAAAVLLTVGLSSPAAYAQTRSMHRGVDGCIAWSYDPGVWSTTVYLHNRCDTTRLAKIAWKWSGLRSHLIWMARLWAC
ncbi:hypothetical protein BOQ63_006780 (plasmid) [Streptomyces viridifaciens]|uniref:hypothetical protein n=1 Tax=Kitasatospora aureofaciens TaxID=1894 RepID=UPI00092ABBC5|nr:hypothetical protein CP971_33955 [Streptomyces viridifaciens]UKZ03778.1 hypothetical protein BOQ63_006780 [Streptomyces viridifaciens]